MSSEIDPKKLQRAKAYYETGLDAAQKRNFEYAFQMLGDACKTVPTSLSFRQGLRAAQRLKYENDPAKVGFMAKTRLQPVRGQIKMAKTTGNWQRVMELCEDAFLLNPWDVGTSMDFAEAALELEGADLAEWALLTVANEAGDHVDFIRLLARVYEGVGKWAAAIGCLERVKALDPTDQDVGSQINRLSANQMMAKSSGLKTQGKPAQPGSSPTAPKPAVGGEDVRVSQTTAEAGTAETENQPAVKLSREEQLKASHEADHGDIHVAMELADLHKAANRWDEADKILSACYKKNPKDYYLRQIYANTRIERMTRALAAMDTYLETHPDDAAAIAKRADVTKRRTEFEIGEFQARIQLNQADAESHFRLGQALVVDNRVDEAIAAFQQARNAPDWKVRALKEIGKCFEQVGSAKLAERSYNDALKAISAEDTATFNELHYRLGTLAERQGQLQMAEEHYNEVAANDYTYKDVARRLRDLQNKI